MEELAIIFSIFLGALTGSALGFGGLVIPAVVVFALLDPLEAVGLLLWAGILINLFILTELKDKKRRGAINYKLILVFVVFSFPGLYLGTLLLKVANQEGLQVLVGSVIILLGIYQYRALGSEFKLPDFKGVVGNGITGFWGLMVGVLTTATTINGPLLMLFFLSHGLKSFTLRYSTTLAFMLMNLGGIILIGVGNLNPNYLFLMVIPVVIIGNYLGKLFFDRYQARTGYYKLLILLIILMGLINLLLGLS